MNGEDFEPLEVEKEPYSYCAACHGEILTKEDAIHVGIHVLCQGCKEQVKYCTEEPKRERKMWYKQGDKV